MHEEKRMKIGPEWKVTEDKLVRTFKFKNFKSAWDFVNAVGAIAEEQNHHPEISFGWGHCTLLLTTHDQGHRTTDKDYMLAEAIDQIKL
jgi:4a-hydroxytetrahydrobiopterin dehydratase